MSHTLPLLELSISRQPLNVILSNCIKTRTVSRYSYGRTILFSAVIQESIVTDFLPLAEKKTRCSVTDRIRLLEMAIL